MTRLKIFLSLALLCVVAQEAFAQYSGGSGTEAAPYQISTVDDWITLCNNVNDLNNGIVCGEPDQEGTINAFVLNFGGEDATEIVNLSDTDESNGWYTLNGIKLNSKPLSKGVYINNGRKIVVK